MRKWEKVAGFSLGLSQKEVVVLSQNVLVIVGKVSDSQATLPQEMRRRPESRHSKSEHINTEA